MATAIPSESVAVAPADIGARPGIKSPLPMGIMTSTVATGLLSIWRGHGKAVAFAASPGGVVMGAVIHCMDAMEISDGKL